MTISFVLQANFHTEAPGIFGLTAGFDGSILHMLLSWHSLTDTQGLPGSSVPSGSTRRIPAK